MANNPVKYLIRNICAYFMDISDLSEIRRSETLIRLHTTNLQNVGDLSFIAEKYIWQSSLLNSKTLKKNSVAILDRNGDGDSKTIDEFLNETTKWLYSVRRIQFQNGRCILFLERVSAIRNIMGLVVNGVNGNELSSYGKQRKNSDKRILIKKINQDLTDCSMYRVKIVQDVFCRVLEYSDWTIIEENDDFNSGIISEVVINTVENLPDQNVVESRNLMLVKCGIVVDPSTGKKSNISTEDYIKMRSNQMHLVALHKYGIRAKHDARFHQLIECLGVAAVTVDMLEVKCSSPVNLVLVHGTGCTRGAAFILYNSARIETLLRTFNARVEEGSMPPLPPFHEVDLSVLTEEEEWQLLYVYVFTFPNLLERTVNLEDGQCAIHLIIRYLEGLVSLFSVYYRRVRILTENREQLVQKVHARVYLIKAVRDVLNKTLALLGIEPMEFM